VSCWYCNPPEATPYCVDCHCDCTRGEPCPCCRPYRRPHRLATEVLAAYDRRIPGARRATACAPRSSFTRDVLIHLLSIADTAMADEDVPARTRHRVMNALAYGSVTPPDVIDREREAAENLTLPGPPVFSPVKLDAGALDGMQSARPDGARDA
jgi:hypothetical protein